jgi:UDP-glucose 4-epimerase
MNQRIKKVVVTGGAGFVGSHLVDRLLADTRGEVIVLDNLSRGRLTNLARHQADPRLQVVEGDVRDAALVAETVRGADLVFHLAAQATVMGAVEDLDYSFSTNVVGTFNVLRESSAGRRARGLRFLARGVANQSSCRSTKASRCWRSISMARERSLGEAYCRASTGQQHGRSSCAWPTPTARARLQARHPLWIDQAAPGQDLHVYGGKQVLDFVWVDQVVDALFCRPARTWRCRRSTSARGPAPGWTWHAAFAC